MCCLTLAAGAEFENNQVREQLREQYFALDKCGQRRMTDPNYARLFRTGLQAGLDLQRSANGLAPAGTAFEPPREPTKAEREAWEKLYFYFAVDPKSGRRLVEDLQHQAKCDAMRDRIFGTTRRNAMDRMMG